MRLRSIGCSELSDQADDDGFNSTVVGIDWLVFIVGRVESNAGIFFEKSLERCVFVIDYCDDELAVLCGRASLTHDIIAVVNVIIDHTVASDLKGEGVVVDCEI